MFTKITLAKNRGIFLSTNTKKYKKTPVTEKLKGFENGYNSASKWWDQKSKTYSLNSLFIF